MNKVIGGRFENCPIKLDGPRRCLYVKSNGTRYYLVKDNIVEYEVRESKNSILTGSTTTCLLEWDGGKKSVIMIDRAYYTFLVNGCELYKSEIDPTGTKGKYSRIFKAVLAIIVGLVVFGQLYSAHQRDVERNNAASSGGLKRLSSDKWSGSVDDLPSTPTDTYLFLASDLPQYNSSEGVNTISGKLYSNYNKTFQRMLIYFDVKDNNAEKIDACQSVQPVDFGLHDVWEFTAVCEKSETYPTGSYLKINSIKGQY